MTLLEQKNGFYAFESALHIFPFPAGTWSSVQDLIRWNLQTTWKYAYQRPLEGLFCFAEDIFGYQFCINEDRICRFDPETGDVEPLTDSVDKWAGMICSNTDVETGFPIAHRWREEHGPLKPGNRLVPVYPFVTSQGSYELSNLYEIEAVKGMLSRADFARQTWDIADGTVVKIVPTNLPK